MSVSPVSSASDPTVSVDGRALARSTGGAARQKRERRRARLRLLRQAIGALVLGGAAVLTVLALRPQPVPVDVGTVQRGPLVVAIEESGRTRVKDRYVVSAPTTGRLSRIWLMPGDTVQEGDTLAEVAPSLAPLIDARSRAEAEARLGAALSSAGQARARLAAASTARERAVREVERSRALVASGSIPPKALEDAEFDLRTQSDALASAEFAVKVANEEVRMARAALGGGERGDAGRHIDVIAPASGQVLRVLQQSAGLVQAGTPLLEVGDPAQLEGVVDLLTTDAVRVRPGTPVVVQGWGGEGPIHARVKNVEPSGFTRLSALGVEEQRVNVILTFTDPPERWATLGDGYHIEARIVTWQSDDVLAVPLLATFRHGGDSAVFRLDGDVVRLTRVTLGHRGELEVEVLGGLEPGDEVVLHPGDRVKDGVKVEVRN